MNRRIDRYILREILAPTALGLLLFTFVLLMNSFFLIAREVIEKDVSLVLVLRMIGYELPRLVRWTLPMAVLMGTLIGIGRMSAQSEIVALRAAGVAFGRISRAVVLLGVVGTILALAVTHLWVPRSIYASRGLRDDLVRSRDMAREMRPRVFYSELPGAVLYADEIVRDGNRRTMERVLLAVDRLDELVDRDDEPRRSAGPDSEAGRRAFILAREGHLSNDRDTGRITLALEDVRQYLFHPARPESLQEVPTEEAFFTFPPPPAFVAFSAPPRKGIEDASLAELAEMRDRVAAAIRVKGANPGRLFRLHRAQFEIHSRTAVPFATLVFALLGFALASVTKRGGRVSGFAYSLFLIILYWTLFSMAQDLGREGRLPPALAAWGTNLVLASAAALLLAVRRARGDQGLLALVSERLTAWGGLRRRRELARPSPPVAQAARMAESAGEALAPAAVRAWGPPRIDRYLAGLYVRVLLYVGAFLLALYLVVEFTSMLDDVLQESVPWLEVLQYFAYFAPGMIRLALPVACLSATLVTIAVLSRHGEITALKAAGLSLGRIARPLLSTTAVACLLFFLAQEYVLPVTNRQAEKILDRIEGRSTYVDESEGRRWIFGEPGRLIGYWDSYGSGRSLGGPTVVELAGDRLSVVRWVRADRAEVREGDWEFRDGWIRSFRGDGETYREFGRLALALPEGPELFGVGEQFLSARSGLSERMGLAALWSQIRDLRRSGYDVTALMVSLYEKVSYPLTPLVMVLLGLPFAFRVGPRGSLYGVGVALALVIAYWAVFALFQSLGREALLSPLLAAGAPNLVFALAGAYLFLTLRS